MSDADYERGQTDARLDISDERYQESLRRFSAIEAGQRATNIKLDEISQMFSLVKSGFRVLLAVGTFSAAVSAFVASIVHWLSGHWK
ncbi:MAG: hypothetical protein RB191_19965 [Terriglobia bacterium]|nr:hypothetical protein [Terriglobia bacterium]